MADIKSSSERSKNMAAIKNHDTKPELFIRKELYSRGFRYYKNYTEIFGHPDLYLSKYKTAVFINGCFWHRHKGCKYAYTPKSRQEFWQKKFNNNIARDQIVQNQLKCEGIRCLIIWECTIKKMALDDNYKQMIFSEIMSFFSDNRLFMEL